MSLAPPMDDDLGMDTNGTHTRIAEGADTPVITGMACSCGWRVDGPMWSAFDRHLKAEGICPRCRNTGVERIENGNHRYTRACRCKAGRTERTGR